MTPPNATSPGLDLVPSLKEAVEKLGLEPTNLGVALETDGQRHIRLLDKRSLAISDGEKMTHWNVATLSELFRGNQLPPSDIEHYPPQYAPYFYEIELQLLTLCKAMGDRTDQELEEIYSALRRRPDGRSLGVAHDFLWQVVVLLLGKYVLSQAEFEGILSALVRSTRRWAQRPISRNYIAYLRQILA